MAVVLHLKRHNTTLQARSDSDVFIGKNKLSTCFQPQGRANDSNNPDLQYVDCVKIQEDQVSRLNEPSVRRRSITALKKRTRGSKRSKWDNLTTIWTGQVPIDNIECSGSSRVVLSDEAPGHTTTGITSFKHEFCTQTLFVRAKQKSSVDMTDTTMDKGFLSVNLSGNASLKTGPHCDIQMLFVELKQCGNLNLDAKTPPRELHISIHGYQSKFTGNHPAIQDLICTYGQSLRRGFSYFRFSHESQRYERMIGLGDFPNRIINPRLPALPSSLNVSTAKAQGQEQGQRKKRKRTDTIISQDSGKEADDTSSRLEMRKRKRKRTQDELCDNDERRCSGMNEPKNEKQNSWLPHIWPFT